MYLARRKGVTVPASPCVKSMAYTLSGAMPVQRTTVTVHADTHEQLEEERQKGETFNDAIQRLLEGGNA